MPELRTIFAAVLCITLPVVLVADLGVPPADEATAGPRASFAVTPCPPPGARFRAPATSFVAPVTP